MRLGREPDKLLIMVDRQFQVFQLLIKERHIVMRFFMKRINGESLPVRFDRLLPLAFFLEKDPEVDMTFDVIGVDGKGFLESLHGFFKTAVEKKEDSKIVMPFLIPWIDLG